MSDRMSGSSLADQLAGYASRRNRLALVLRGRYRSRHCTYRELSLGAAGFSARLASAGVERGDRVLLRGPNSPEWVAAFLGCVRLGAAAVPVDSTADDGFAGRVLREAGCRAAVLDSRDAWDPSHKLLEPAFEFRLERFDGGDRLA